MGYQRRVHGDSQDSLCILTREKMMKTFTSLLILGILAMLLADSCVGVPACGPDDDGGVDGMEDTRFGCPQRRGGHEILPGRWPPKRVDAISAWKNQLGQPWKNVG